MFEPAEPRTPSQVGHGVKLALRGILDGARLRCPNCRQGHIARRFFGEDHVCEVCGHDFEYQPGEFTGAIIIAQFIWGVLAIPIFIVLTLVTDWTFTWRAVGTVGIATGGLAFFYRNVKGAWYGWIWGIERGGVDHQTESRPPG